MGVQNCRRLLKKRLSGFVPLNCSCVSFAALIINVKFFSCAMMTFKVREFLRVLARWQITGWKTLDHCKQLRIGLHYYWQIKNHKQLILQPVLLKWDLFRRIVYPGLFWPGRDRKIKKHDLPSIHGKISVEHLLAHLLSLDSPGKFQVRELISQQVGLHETLEDTQLWLNSLVEVLRWN